MTALLLILGAIFAYLFFDKGFWLDTWAKARKKLLVKSLKKNNH